ncbi:MAG: alpha/beta fold hydrolase [Proteobacteria bacterium]|nr:alpha/beta fold hydrolase [Pseudomonadota bacterium]HQR02951.1 alpha/beta fold hydrolase [Rhodocyclaceae bacterium]
MNSHFHAGAGGFSAYIDTCRRLITEGRAEAAVPASVIAGNLPFEHLPGGTVAAGRHTPCRRGIVLIHGLTDSPYLCTALGRHFRDRGFRVMAPLLPGHGTRPGDLLDVRWQEWSAAVAFSADCMAREADEIHLAGISTGATLALLHALDDDRIRSLCLFSPALRLAPKAAWARWHTAYSWMHPPSRWVSLRPDDDPYKYESLCKNAVAQIHSLTRRLAARPESADYPLPLFAAASLDDATVEADATTDFMARARHRNTRCVLYTRHPDQPPPDFPAGRLTLVDSRVPEQHILSSAHTAIVVPPEDPHYGENAPYANCNHYHPHDPERYRACRDPALPAWRGETTMTPPDGGLLRRLTYNPRFAGLASAIDQFFCSLPSPDGNCS